jgi:hypothetical protein
MKARRYTNNSAFLLKITATMRLLQVRKLEKTVTLPKWYMVILALSREIIFWILFSWVLMCDPAERLAA